MSTAIMTLKKFIGTPPPWGAFSRVAEFSGLSIWTVRRIYNGAKRVSASAHKKAQDAVHARVDLSPKIRKDKGKKKKK